MCVCFCVYTQFAKIPQPHKLYPGTCDTGLSRKFHILLYHRTSVSVLFLDEFQKSHNYYCYKRAGSMWKWWPAGVFFLLLLSTCPKLWSLRVFFIRRQWRPALLDLERVTLLSLTGKRLYYVRVCGQVVKAAVLTVSEALDIITDKFNSFYKKWQAVSICEKNVTDGHQCCHLVGSSFNNPAVNPTWWPIHSPRFFLASSVRAHILSLCLCN